MIKAGKLDLKYEYRRWNILFHINLMHNFKGNTGRTVVPVEKEYISNTICRNIICVVIFYSYIILCSGFCIVRGF